MPKPAPFHLRALYREHAPRQTQFRLSEDLRHAFQLELTLIYILYGLCDTLEIARSLCKNQHELTTMNIADEKFSRSQLQQALYQSLPRINFSRNKQFSLLEIPYFARCVLCA